MLLMGATSAHADTVRVIDGDGFELNGKVIRIWGIDAPELTQTCRNRFWWSYPCGKRSKAFLEQILQDSTPVCRTITRDKYGRLVSKCFVDGEDLAALIVRAGWAVDFTRYSGGKYAEEQAQAEAEKRGIWAGSFDMPSDVRKQGREL
ncbi:MAG: thermonuclease family protein [Pseudomonadota bacterium]